MLHSQDYYRHHAQRVSANRNELHNMFLSYNMGKEWETHDSRWAKRHPMDCGNPGCPVCHMEKLEKRRFTLSDAELERLLAEEDMEL